jgi:hypothetical protein
MNFVGCMNKILICTHVCLSVKISSVIACPVWNQHLWTYLFLQQTIQDTHAYDLKQRRAHNLNSSISEQEWNSLHKQLLGLRFHSDDHFFFFFTGATTLCGDLASSMVLPHRLWRFHNSRFFLGYVVSPMPKSQPGGPGTTFRLAPTLWPLWHGWPYQKLTLPPA